MKKKFLIIISIIFILLITISILKTEFNKNKIPDNWKIEISPSYYFEPGNSILLYDDYYIVTYSIADNKNNLIYLKDKIDKQFVEQIEKEIIEEASVFDKNDDFPYYYAQLKNEDRIIYLSENSNVIKKIEDVIKNEIWYVTPTE